MVTLDLFCAAMASNNYIAERKRANPAPARSVAWIYTSHSASDLFLPNPLKKRASALVTKRSRFQ